MSQDRKGMLMLQCTVCTVLYSVVQWCTVLYRTLCHANLYWCALCNVALLIDTHSRGDLNAAPPATGLRYNSTVQYSTVQYYGYIGYAIFLC